MPQKRSKSRGDPVKQVADQGIASAVFCEEGKWNANLAFVVGYQVEDNGHIEALVTAVKGGTRKLFTSLSCKDLFNEVHDLSSTKSPRKGKDVPQFSEVFESYKHYTDNREEIPLPLLAKLIKIKLLDIKSQDLKRREIEKKALEEQDKSSKGNADRREMSRSLTKGTKNASGKGRLSEPSITKAESKLKKRGEEDLAAKYINDEPDDGPELYIIITGFHHPHLLSYLAEIGINVDAIININSQSYDSLPVKQEAVVAEAEGAVIASANSENFLAANDEDEVKKKEKEKTSVELKKFWQDVLLIMEKAANNSSLHDVARLEYMVPNSALPPDTDVEAKAAFGTTLFEVVACMLYNLLDAKRQWKNYLANLRLLHIPLESEAAERHDSSEPGNASPLITLSRSKMESAMDVDCKHNDSTVEVDMRLYNDLMNAIPAESVSIPLVMHCMLEQVCAYEHQANPEQVPNEKTDCSEDGFAQRLNTLVFKLALTTDERKILYSDYLPPPAKAVDDLKQPLLISYHDDITRRLNHIEPIGDFNPIEAELRMLGYSRAATLLSAFPEASDQKTALERSARFQELLFFCFQQNTVSKSDINHALQQFVFECMNLTMVDEDGKIYRPMPPQQNDIPWDDPYPFYVGSISVDHSSREGSDLERADSACKDSDADKVGENEGHISRSVSILKRPESFGSRKRASSCHSVHFEEVDSGQSLQHPGDEDLEEGKDSSDSCKQNSSTFSAQNSSCDLSQVVNDNTKRNLDAWQFAEQMEPQLLLQAILRTLETHPYVDTYYQKRDNTFLIVLHNPYNPNISHSFDDWHVELHSNVRFRNYLEYVAGRIMEWTQVEEAKYEANLLAAEVEQLQKEEEGVSPVDKRQGSSKSPRKSSESRTGKSSTGSSLERSTPCEPFVRAGSLKAWKEEQTRLKAEEEEHAKQTEERRSKSAQQKTKNVQADERKAREKESKKRRDSKLVENEATEQAKQEKLATPEKYWPFTGYDVGNKLIHVAGTSSTLFPDDGGQILTERIDYLHGSTSVKATVRKNGHSLTVHIIDPKQVHEEEEEEEKKEVDAETGDARQQSDQLPHDDSRKTDEDKNETCKERRAASDDSAGLNGTKEESSEPNPPGKSLPEKPCVARFGSFTAQFNDGVTLSMSCFGPTGESPNGKPYEPEPYSPPTPVVTQQTGGTEKDASLSKRQRANDRASKEKDKQTLVEVIAAPPEAEVKEDVVKEVEQVSEPFQQLYVTCPDGLNVTYILESSFGISLTADEKRLLVKQSYPMKMKGLQKCEGARKTAMQEHSRVIMSDGTVIKTMLDGSTKVLFADGAVSEFCHSSSLLPLSFTSVSELLQVTKTATSPGPKKKTGRRSTKNCQLESVTPAEEDVQEKGYWITTLPSGERVANRLGGAPVQVPNAVLCIASDPQTCQVMHTRDDHVITVHHPDGLVIVEHSDGTRITTKFQEVTVQPDGLAEAIPPNAVQPQIIDVPEPDQQESSEQNQDKEVDTEVEVKDEMTNEEEEMMNEILVEDTDAVVENDETMPASRKVVKYVLVECPGFASVRFDTASGFCSTEFASGCVVECMTDGRYDIFHQTGSCLRLDPDGTAVFYSQPDTASPGLEFEPQFYLLRHFDSIIAETIDKQGTHYVVTNFGVNHVSPLSEACQELELEPQHTDINSCFGKKNFQLRDSGKEFGSHVPKMFVVNSDGNGMELLRSEDVASYLSKAENDPKSLVLTAPLPDLPDVYGITVLQPLLRNASQTWLKGYLHDSIIPPGLKSRDLHRVSPEQMKSQELLSCKGLQVSSRAEKVEIFPITKKVVCPSVLEFRQLIKYHPVTESLRTKLTCGVKAYADHVKKRAAYYQEVSVVDARTEEEKVTAEALEAQLTLPYSVPINMKSVEELKSVYENALTPVEHPKITASAKIRRKKYDLEKVKREIEEEKACLLALKQHNITPYFQSELASSYFINGEGKPKRTLNRQFIGYLSCGESTSCDDSELPTLPGIVCRHVSPQSSETPDKRNPSESDIVKEIPLSSEAMDLLDDALIVGVSEEDNNTGNNDGAINVSENPDVDLLISNAGKAEETLIMSKSASLTSLTKYDQNEGPISTNQQFPYAVDDVLAKHQLLSAADDDALPTFKMPEFKGLLADIMSGKNAEDIEKSLNEKQTSNNSSLSSSHKDLKKPFVKNKPAADYMDSSKNDFEEVVPSVKDAVVREKDKTPLQVPTPSSANGHIITNCDEDDPFLVTISNNNIWHQDDHGQQNGYDRLAVHTEHVSDDSLQQALMKEQDSSFRDFKCPSDVVRSTVGSFSNSCASESLQFHQPSVLGYAVDCKRPGATQNRKCFETEDPVRRKVNNVIVTGATPAGFQAISRMRRLELLPERIDFGILKEGNTYAYNVSLKNTGVDACRFRIKQPPPSTGVKVLYRPGPVAAGMKTDIQVEIYAIAAGVEGDRGIGLIAHNIEVTTETDQMLLPLTATVLTANEFDCRGPDSPKGGKANGVKFISSKPPAGVGLIRPRKYFMHGESVIVN